MQQLLLKCLKNKRKKEVSQVAFTVLAIILVLAAVLTHIVPSGQFSRLTYDDSTNEFVITDHENNVTTEPATQEVLDRLQIQLSLDKFTEGVIQKTYCYSWNLSKNWTKTTRIFRCS